MLIGVVLHYLIGSPQGLHFLDGLSHRLISLAHATTTYEVASKSFYAILSQSQPTTFSSSGANYFTLHILSFRHTPFLWHHAKSYS